MKEITEERARAIAELFKLVTEHPLTKDQWRQVLKSIGKDYDKELAWVRANPEESEAEYREMMIAIAPYM